MNFRKFLTVAAVSTALIVPALSVPAFAALGTTTTISAALRAQLAACATAADCAAIIAAAGLTADAAKFAGQLAAAGQKGFSFDEVVAALPARDSGLVAAAVIGDPASYTAASPN